MEVLVGEPRHVPPFFRELPLAALFCCCQIVSDDGMILKRGAMYMNKEDRGALVVVLIFVGVSLWAYSNYLYFDERWIGAIGSIIGGSMTLVGVGFTIQHQKNEIQKQEKQFQEQLQAEKDKFDQYLELHEKAILDIQHKTTQLDFFDSIMFDEVCNIVRIEKYDEVREAFKKYINNRLQNIEPKKLEYALTLLRSKSFEYLEVKNIGAGNAFDIYWRLEVSDADVLQSGRIERLEKEEILYFPITFNWGKSNMKNVSLSIVYKDSTFKCRKVTYEGGRKKMTEGTEETLFYGFIRQIEEEKSTSTTIIETYRSNHKEQLLNEIMY